MSKKFMKLEDLIKTNIQCQNCYSILREKNKDKCNTVLRKTTQLF